MKSLVHDVGNVVLTHGETILSFGLTALLIASPVLIIGSLSTLFHELES